MSSIPPASLRVRVPCSTSNLGPGFDCLGLALSLFLEVELELHPSGGCTLLGRLEDEAAAWPREQNLLLRAFEVGARALALDAPAGTFHARSQIPLARGLGSSGAAVAAGLLLANALAPHPLDPSELCRLGCELEGHPDNSTASLLGGCTLGVRAGERLAVIRPPLHPSLAFAAAWPAAQVPTRRARAVLPARVSFSDAAENPRRLALLLEGLRRADPELLALGEADRLHVPYRLPLIAGAERALAAARAAGAFLATISGSGSALIAITSAARVAAVERALAAGLEGPGVESRRLEPVLEAPRVEVAPTEPRPGERG